MSRDTFIYCPECEFREKHTTKLRKHFKDKHPEAHPHDLEYRIVTTINPQLDVDLLLVRYLDQLETVIGLKKQGIFVKHFLENIGVARSDKDDKSLMSRMKWEKASKERKFEVALNRQLTWLKKDGLFDELSEVVTALKLIRYAKNELAKAQEPEPVPEPEEKLIGRYTFLLVPETT